MTTLSIVISVHNEEDKLDHCLSHLGFGDELVVLLDKCTDRSREIAARHTDRLVDGAWELEGDRRNAGIDACNCDWVLEVDADETVSPDLAAEIRRIIETTGADWHEIPVDNYIGGRLVRYGWGASFGKAAYPGLFRRGVKRWARQRVHPSLTWSGRKGAMLTQRLRHDVDKNISSMIRRLDNYSTARARDLRDAGETWGSTCSNVRRLFSRFFKCYVARKGYREGGYGFLIALFAGMYPLMSHLKARLEKE
ncbi:MAG: glycosyltransferase family 2 protein [Rhodospirillales bacterium]